MNITIHLKNYRDRLFDVDGTEHIEQAQADHRPVILFLLIILFNVFYQLGKQPGWVLGGEMWAEMATNYYPNANASSYLQKLFSTDAGYIPAPQRLIALVGNLINLSAASIPYFYTWSSIILTGMMVGIFCLSPFRTLVKSDWLRFLTAISILMVADFQTRTFINFTYFSAFFVAIVTALALIEKSEEVPRWSWCIPILMISKPAVLAILPAMILVAVVSQPRFRLIAIVAVVLCIGQFLQMFMSSTAGTMPFRANDITIISKLLATFKYFFGFLGGYVTGPSLQLNKYFLMVAGLFIFGISFCLLIFKKNKANALIIVGLSLLFFNVLLNAFALSDLWTQDLARLDGIPVYRHIIVGFSGCILVMCGIFSLLADSKLFKLSGRFRGDIAALFFSVWFLSVGWFSFSGKISKEPSSPIINNSQWQSMAGAIDSGVAPLCVPIDPWVKGANWMYQRNCGLLKSAPAWEDGHILIKDKLSVDLEPPAILLDKTLVAAAVMVRPFSSGKTFVEVLMRIEFNDGNIRYFSGARDLSSSGGLLLLTGKDHVAIKDISSVRLIFNLPVEIALAPDDPAGVPGIAWMGN